MAGKSVTMENTTAEFFKYIWPILAAPLGWCIMQINNLKKEHYETRIHSAETYVKYEDYREDIRSFHAKLDKINDKLDNKADK